MGTDDKKTPASVHIEVSAQPPVKVLVYGAKSLALGACRALQACRPELQISGFLVTSLNGNPTKLADLPVWEAAEFASALTPEEKDAYHILIAAPEDLHLEMRKNVEALGFCHDTCLDSAKESSLMEQYFKQQGIFPSIHDLEPGTERAKLRVYIAQFYKDRSLRNSFEPPEWANPLQVGAALTDVRIAADTDDDGPNISIKNVNYCELTALYWMWKNKLGQNPVQGDAEYYGLYHYRRVLDIREEDLYRLKANDVDAVLPFPTLHEPDCLEHHSRYISELDWAAMRGALAQLHPEYAKALPGMFAGPYLYNYNLVLAKKQVLADYCAWLFPILERTEELSDPRGWQRADRYIGYLGENLLTLYFMYHQKDLKIYHTGRLMLT